MSKLTNTKFNRLLKYYTLINHDLIYNNKTINRYKNKVQNKNKSIKLEKLKQNISNINNCHLKKNATVTECHIETLNIREHTKCADILISACGNPEMIKKDWIQN